jgi:hypothetical protein
VLSIQLDQGITEVGRSPIKNSLMIVYCGPSVYMMLRLYLLDVSIVSYNTCYCLSKVLQCCLLLLLLLYCICILPAVVNYQHRVAGSKESLTKKNVILARGTRNLIHVSQILRHTLSLFQGQAFNPTVQYHRHHRTRRPSSRNHSSKVEVRTKKYFFFVLSLRQES